MRLMPAGNQDSITSASASTHSTRKLLSPPSRRPCPRRNPPWRIRIRYTCRTPTAFGFNSRTCATSVDTTGGPLTTPLQPTPWCARLCESVRRCGQLGSLLTMREPVRAAPSGWVYWIHTTQEIVRAAGWRFESSLPHQSHLPVDHESPASLTTTPFARGASEPADHPRVAMSDRGIDGEMSAVGRSDGV